MGLESKQTLRHQEVSEKLLKISKSLNIEGIDSDDEILEMTGNLIMLVSGVMTNKEDLHTLSDLCAMFSAKKILDEKLSGLTDEDILGLD